MGINRVDIGVFAHNEEGNIGQLLDDLAQQSLLCSSSRRVRVHILCNGCFDSTEVVARKAVERNGLSGSVRFDVSELSGKSRTWNRFVGCVADGSDALVFIDADVRIPSKGTIAEMIEELEDSEAIAVTSHPIKNLSVLRSKPLLRMAASSIVRKHRDGPISGQLYAVKASALRSVRLPVPCLVEDGFLSACLITDIFSHERRPDRVRASATARHYFLPFDSLKRFFRHDVRLAVGRELNAALFSALWREESVERRLELLHEFSNSVGIERCIEEHLQHPERSALGRMNWRARIFGSRSEGIWSRSFKFPLRLAHFVYLELVRRRARKEFAARRFLW